MIPAAAQHRFCELPNFKSWEMSCNVCAKCWSGWSLALWLRSRQHRLRTHSPRDFPTAVRDRIAADIRDVVSDPEINSKLSATGQVVNPGTPAELTAVLDDQRATVAKIGDTLGIKPAR